VSTRLRNSYAIALLCLITVTAATDRWSSILLISAMLCANALLTRLP
jgi:hypothetical protein